MQLIPPLIRVYLWVAIAAVFSLSMNGCARLYPPKKIPVTRNPNPTSANIQLVVNVSDEEIRDKIVARITKQGRTINRSTINIRRCPCDSKLLNITLPDSFTIEGNGEDLAVKSSGGGQSGGIDLPGANIPGFNYRITTFDSSRRGDKPYETRLGEFLKQNGTNPSQKIAIGVFDSGLNPDLYLPGQNWKQPVAFCKNDALDPMNTSEIGWNFVSASGGWNVTADDHPVSHGSRGAHLVTRQFNGSTATPKIVPLKVLKADNTGDLFGLLCAMETARLNNVRVFNMSLGYYGPADRLLFEYMKKSTDAGIWIVTAAGNSPLDEVAAANRNLITMPDKFYPASFSQTLDHVIAVTTVHRVGNQLKACERQNYAKEFVLGVMQDENCRFDLESPNVLIFGTSYAAPVLAGWLARKLAEGTTFPNRDSIVTAMEQAASGNEVYQNRYVKSISNTTAP